jgi:hypothetical protein
MLLRFTLFITKFKIVIDWLKEFHIKSIVISSQERSYKNFLAELKKDFDYKPNSSKNILLVPFINDLGTMKIVTQIAYKMAVEENFSIKYFYLHSGIDRKVLRNSKLGFFVNQFLQYNFFLKNKLCRIYQISNKDIILFNYFIPSYNIINEVRISSKKELLEINYKNIPIGELIFDTYLRFRSKPDLDLDDNCLYDIYAYFKTLIDYWNKGLNRFTISRLLVPYTAYHHWGIPAYTCLAKNIDVVTFGSVNYVFSRPTLAHPYHSKNFHLYPEIFRQLINKAECIQLAKEVLNSRLGGNVDSGTSYMKGSAFSDNTDLSFSPPNNNYWCVVFLHCFFDSPHIYGKSIFSDFYEWIIYILNHAAANPNTKFYIKEHPNALPDNEEVINRLKNMYSQFKNIIFLPGKVSNKQIAAKKPNAVFTVYGTVAHEFAALKIPVVVAGENPQSMYGFIHKPSNVEEFKEMLNSIGSLKLPASYQEDEIYEFFYIHYQYYSKKYHSRNFDKRLDLGNGVINLTTEIPCSDLFFQ